MKTLLLLRHGQAGEAPTDFARALTSKGQLQTTLMAEQNIEALQAVETLLVSPYNRAQQTADIVQNCLADAHCAAMQREVCDLLTPDSPPQALFDYLQARSEERLLLVAHNPLLTRVLNLLTGQTYNRYVMDTSSLAAVETGVVAASCAEFLWLRHAD